MAVHISALLFGESAQLLVQQSTAPDASFMEMHSLYFKINMRAALSFAVANAIIKAQSRLTVEILDSQSKNFVHRNVNNVLLYNNSQNNEGLF